MASKTFLLLALVFAFVLLITSEVIAAEDLAAKHDGVVDGRGGYNKKGGGHGGMCARRGKIGGCAGCRYGCCGGKACRCCSSVEEATANKQTQN